MKSFFVTIFLLVPYLILSVQGVTNINMPQHDNEMMSCCADETEENPSMDCCKKPENNDHDCGSSSCDEMGCNIPLQLKNLYPALLFNFDKVAVTDKLSFSLKDRNIVAVNLESIWNPPKFIS